MRWFELVGYCDGWQGGYNIWWDDVHFIGYCEVDDFIDLVRTFEVLMRMGIGEIKVDKRGVCNG